MILTLAAFVALVSPADARAIAPECAGVEVPADYDEDVQQAFLANHLPLGASFSPLHGPTARPAGTGGVDLRLALLPPLSCAHRLALGGQKTEDTNKSPLLPLLAGSYTFRLPVRRLAPYVGGGWMAVPVEVAGTFTQIFAVEAGLGWRLSGDDARLSHHVGLRGHSALAWVVGEIATPRYGGPPYNDVFVGTATGLDLSYGLVRERLAGPRWELYGAVGLLDVNTFFFTGDDSVAADNVLPYLGPAASIGGVVLIGGWLRVALEGYAAPGGARPVFDEADPVPFGRAGHLYTVRASVGVQSAPSGD